MQQKKIPMRKCIGCGEMKPKKELIRIVRSPEGEFDLDVTGKKSGRGAYICKNPECFTLVKKGKKLNRSFETSVPDEIYDKLESELNGI